MNKKYIHIIIGGLFLMYMTGIYLEARADISNPHPTPPSNSVTTGMLQNGAVTDIKISSSTPVSLFKIGQAGDNSVPYFKNNSMHASSSALYYNVNNNRFGIGSSTPGYNLSVQGDARISGTTTVSTLDIASSTLKSGNFIMHLPTADGVAGDSLHTDGLGHFTFSSGGDWIKLGEIISQISTTTLTLNFTTQSYLKVYIDIPTIEGTPGDKTMYFNNDIGNNYSGVTLNNAVVSSNTNTSGINILYNGYPGVDCSFDVVNVASTTIASKRQVHGGCLMYNDAGDSIAAKTMNWLWKYSTSTISSISILSAGADRMATGSSIRVYGSAN